MSAISPEDRAAMRESFARLLASDHTEARMRATTASPAGFDRSLWGKVGEMGLLAVLVAEENGGLGAGMREMGELFEEAGKALYTAPLLESAVIATSLLALSADAEARARLLSAMAAGETIAIPALTGDSGTWDAAGVAVEAAGDLLSGHAAYVNHAASADVLLVAAREGAGVALYEVAPATDGVTLTPQPANDPSLRLSRINFEGAAARRIEGADAAVIRAALDRGRVAQAGEQAGGSRHVLDMTVAYMLGRYQFGRPIGSYQALKHMAADLLVEVESALSAARHAAAAMDDGSADAVQLVSLAGFACADAYVEVTAQAIQMHGGIAYTTEYPLHLYWRRARSLAQMLGSSGAFCEQYLGEWEKAA
ncbi:MAG: acyl-CoA dehydrogenase family protein [Novosphingobium sp.]|nr:acyl-CoA dehydrogenase family protein [Novosphingobium sp.]